MTDNKTAPSRLLQWFDKASGILIEVFDPRLLTVAIASVMFYCTLFIQRKFPGRWMEFVALGMVLIAFVTMVARTPEMRQRIRWHPVMVGLWFALHGWMLLSGFFYEDWLSESLALLVAYPFMFAVFTAREDENTLYAISRGAVFGILPFLIWSFVGQPLVFGYPGWSGVFYNANGLAMCCNVMTACAMLLCYASWRKRKLPAVALYGVIFLLGSFAIALTMSRSAWVAYAAAMLVLLGGILMGRTKHVGRVVALLCAVALVFGGAIATVSYIKAKETIRENYEIAIKMDERNHWGIVEPNPDEYTLQIKDFSSSRTEIWEQALTHLTWNGHPTAVVEEWVKINGGWNRRNAHNSFIGVAYNNGWPAGLLLIAYVLFSAWRAWIYYWRRRSQPMAILPFLIACVFVLESLFESVYAPFSVVGCAYLLTQGMLWRADLSPEAAP